MEKQFIGKSALVTGAAAGIGRATAVAFARAGAAVLVADLNEKGGLETCEQIRAEGGRGEFFRCDLSRAPEVAAMVDRAVQTFGRLDFACNNAGIEGPTAPTADYPEAEWDRVLAVNLKSVWLCMRQEIPRMLEQGGGAIVNIASIAGVIGFPGASAYVASKHGVIGLTRAAALEYARQGVRVNAICPGIIRTEMIDRSAQGNPDAIKQLEQGTPLGRMGRPEEIASAAVWLCSEGGGYTVGHPLVVDGGWVAQ
jgi:NAD(P)-dependent dehydrogenase (short-subunit alcohol dehydrogenase family)